MSGKPFTILSATNLAVGVKRSHESPLVIAKDISLQVPINSIVSILGASGCGKSTVLKTLSGLLPALSGEINTTIETPGPHIGYQEQGGALLPWLPLIQNVSLGLELLGTGADTATQKAITLLESVGLKNLHNTYPRHLSGGMTQRALLARTLATGPALLLLDEPFGQLDIVVRRELGELTKSYVRQHSAAAIIVTHSVEEAVSLSDYIFVLSSKEDAPHQLFAVDSPALSGSISLSREHAFNNVYSHIISTLAEGTPCAQGH